MALSSYFSLLPSSLLLWNITESNDKESSNDKTEKLKVGWEKCDDGNCDPSRFSKFPGYRVARKVRMFRQKQKHKKMVEAYQAYRDKINRENEILVKTQQRIIKAEKEAKERQEHEQHCEYIKLDNLSIPI